MVLLKERRGKVNEIRITENEAEQRLDRFLKKYLKEASLGLIYKLIRTKMIRVNGKKAKENYRLQLDDIIQFNSSLNIEQYFPTRKQAVSYPQEFTIIYEDHHVLVVDKPAGLLVHANKPGEQRTLNRQVLSYLIETNCYHPDEEKTFIPAPSNRLDRNTSGLVLFAKNYLTQQALNKMIREKMIDKYYLTLVSGQVKVHGKQRLNGYLLKDNSTNLVSISETYQAGSVPIQTEYKVLKKLESATLLEINLITGRSHQIRAHLASIGYPIIGDSKYGIRELNIQFAMLGLKRQFLHASRLIFSQTFPQLDYLKGQEFESPLPNDLKKIEYSILQNL